MVLKAWSSVTGLLVSRVAGLLLPLWFSTAGLGRLLSPGLKEFLVSPRNYTALCIMEDLVLNTNPIQVHKLKRTQKLRQTLKCEASAWRWGWAKEPAGAVRSLSSLGPGWGKNCQTKNVRLFFPLYHQINKYLCKILSPILFF